MRDGGHHETFEIGEQTVHRLALIRPRRGQRVPKLARFHPRQHGIAFRMGKIIGDPIDGGVREAAKLFRRHSLY